MRIDITLEDTQVVTAIGETGHPPLLAAPIIFSDFS